MPLSHTRPIQIHKKPSFTFFVRLFLALLTLFSVMQRVQAALPINRDTSFITLSMDGLPNSSILLSDGKILIAGSFQTIGGTTRRALARLNSDGSLDTTFNPPIAAPGTFGKPVAAAMTRLADGRILVAGSSSFSTTGILRTNIVRFNADGSVDGTFNANTVNHYLGLAVQADNKVLFTGYTNGAGLFIPRRLNADGSLDSTFNYSTGIGTGLYGLQFLAQTDGHTLLLAGDNNPSVGGIQNLVWLKADGSLDNTFKFPDQLQDEGRFAVNVDGSLLVAGYAPNFVPKIQKLSAAGNADPIFSFLTQPNNQGVHPVPAAFLPDGGAVLVRNPTAGDRRVSFFFLTPEGKLSGSRDLPNATIDNGVVGVGTLTTRAFAMQTDGKLLFAQAFFDGSANVFGMFRLAVQPVAALPVITVQPTAIQSIGAGESLFLSVTATSESPLTYQWQHETTNLSAQVGQSLSLGQNSTERSGNFVVIVGNTFGYSTSQVSVVTVRPPAPMVFNLQPVGGSVKLASPFTFSASCTSETTLGYQWYKNNVLIPTGGGRSSFIGSLVLPANDAQRTGDYFVYVTNDFGGAITSSVVHLDVILPAPPVISAQPLSQSLYTTQPLQLNVAAASDGALSYQWQHAGTNLKTSPTILSVTSSQLNISATDASRFGDFVVVITASPGGITTSQTATVTKLPSGPPVFLSLPPSFTVPFGTLTNVMAGFNGESPLGFFVLHAGTNVLFGGNGGQQYPVLNAPTTNGYSFAALLTTDGSYQFVLTNLSGSVTSQVTQVTVTPAVPATILADLTNVVVGVGEFNFVSLASGLVVTNLGVQETTHILSFSVKSGLPPYIGTGVWQLALGVSNRFYVGDNTGASKSAGTWGFAPAAPNYLALSLTNFPRLNDVSRLEAYEDGTYGVLLNGNPNQAQAGTYRVLGQRRPATNTFTIDISSPNPVGVAWLKDGAPLNFINRAYLTSVKANGVIPPGGVNNRYQLSIPDVGSGDVGNYSLAVTNLFPNPDHTFGQPVNLITSVTFSHSALLALRGFAETTTPGLASNFELAISDVSAQALLPDGSVLLASLASVRSLGADGHTNWSGPGLPSQTRAVASDGFGGAFVAGQDQNGASWFLNRVQPNAQNPAVATNVWSTTVEGPSANYFDNFNIPHGAEAGAIVNTPSGVLVAGRFKGKSRFGSTVVGGINAPVGGVSITNFYNLAFGQDDGSWDLFVAKYNLTGQLLWIIPFGGTNNDLFTSLTTDAAGNLYLAGSFKGSAKFGNVTLESTKRIDSPTVTTYAYDGFIAKLAPDGSTLWAKNYGGFSLATLSDTQLASAAADAAGNLYFTASRSQVALTIQPGIAVGSRFIARVNTIGELQWGQTIVTTGPSILALDSAGNAVLADNFQANLNALPVILGAASVDRRQLESTLIAKFAPTGTLLWARSFNEKLVPSDDAHPVTIRQIGFNSADELVVSGMYASSISFTTRLNASSAGPAIGFTPPAPGATTLKLTWPIGFVLQRRNSLASGQWETLNVNPPYDASLFEFTQAFYRVISVP